MKMWVMSWQTPWRSAKASAAMVTTCVGLMSNFISRWREVISPCNSGSGWVPALAGGLSGNSNMARSGWVGAGARRCAVGEFDDGRVGLREGSLAQEQARGKPLNRAADDAASVVGIDFAFDADRQLAERALRGERMRDVTQNIFVLL